VPAVRPLRYGFRKDLQRLPRGELTGGAEMNVKSTDRFYIVTTLSNDGTASQEKKTTNFDEAINEYWQATGLKRLIEVVKHGDKQKEKIIYSTYL
jgi:hypothetical protein